jgi:hypothetical protein
MSTILRIRSTRILPLTLLLLALVTSATAGANLGAGTIDHVVNGLGDPADTTRVGAPVYIVEYP